MVEAGDIPFGSLSERFVSLILFLVGIEDDEEDEEDDDEEDEEHGRVTDVEEEEFDDDEVGRERDEDEVGWKEEDDDEAEEGKGCEEESRGASHLLVEIIGIEPLLHALHRNFSF
jgi:hypothetical protein